MRYSSMPETPDSTLEHPANDEERALIAWSRLTSLTNQLGRRVEQVLLKHGLSTAQFDVLSSIHRHEGMTQQELAKTLLVTKGNICGLIDRMEAAGWVARRNDPFDRRTNRLYLTESGRQQLDQTTPSSRPRPTPSPRETTCWSIQKAESGRSSHPLAPPRSI